MVVVDRGAFPLTRGPGSPGGVVLMRVGGGS